MFSLITVLGLSATLVGQLARRPCDECIPKMMSGRSLFIGSCCLLVLLIHPVQPNPIVPRADVATEFIILHNNDMHARFEQTSVTSGICSQEDANTNQCYGGFARVAYEVRKYRKEAQEGGTPVFYLNAGDTYTGTAWFTVYKDKIASAFLNKLSPDAISLGNHEFDQNVEGLVPFLNAVDFPVLACNLNLTDVPEMAAAKQLANSTILETNGVKIGVIGYLTPDTKVLAFRNKVEYEEEIVSINAEAEKLKAQGINIIIALGHSGYQKDQEIAKNCPEVDIVIGGHSHTFLDASQPVADPTDSDPEAVRGPYPTTVVQASGKKVPVVQAYAYTKYLGKIHVQFDAEGNLIEFDGAPILLNASVTQEQDLLDLLEEYRPKLEELENTILGYTKVFLEGGNICRMRECNLGNLVTDAMVYARVLDNKGGEFWTDAPIAFMQGGGIRASVEKQADGAINGATLLTVLPFENNLYITRILGKTLLAALEHSAAVRLQDSNGGFLQMSGLRCEYNYNNEQGKRVVFAQALCSNCSVPTYKSINETEFYKVIVPQFLLEGGDGYDLIEESDPFSESLERNDLNATMEYLKQRHFVYPEIEERIVIHEKADGNSASGILASITLLLLSSLLTRFF
ncbi:protein 5NUC-like isoform X1 [Drosophila subpulchrella]|uniref:protein 5NUC-like isoform X1 n=2 Tax=Drosophila subpulchrella TaxID=1486046 RepID=UPI0018A193BA|nr:protein 5NUC-like isoform X1 [Drosophila subpulchrella]